MTRIERFLLRLSLLCTFTPAWAWLRLELTDPTVDRTEEVPS